MAAARRDRTVTRQHSSPKRIRRTCRYSLTGRARPCVAARTRRSLVRSVRACGLLRSVFGGATGFVRRNSYENAPSKSPREPRWHARQSLPARRAPSIRTESQEPHKEGEHQGRTDLQEPRHRKGDDGGKKGDQSDDRRPSRTSALARCEITDRGEDRRNRQSEENERHMTPVFSDAPDFECIASDLRVSYFPCLPVRPALSTCRTPDGRFFRFGRRRPARNGSSRAC